MEIFALIIIFILATASIWLVVVIGNLPGRLARDNDHPQSEAIAMLGWLGLVFGGVGWLIAMVWACFKPPIDATLAARVAALEAQVAASTSRPEGDS